MSDEPVFCSECRNQAEFDEDTGLYFCNYCFDWLSETE